MRVKQSPALAAFLWIALAGRLGLAVSITIDPDAAPRVEYGAARLAEAMNSIAWPVTVLVGGIHSASIEHRLQTGQLVINPGELKPEGFIIAAVGEGTIAVVGADDSGELYGCLELSQRIQHDQRLPKAFRFVDAPAFKLRGTCIGMQKTFILPGRHVYEYPYTPVLFPFFYDKEFWRQYLDFLVDHRMNTLYLWSGHPFASLVKLPDYPFALEVSENVYRRNVDMFRYIATEADKRGIWVVQMFYNILVSQPFARHYGIDTQLSAPTPLVADYTRKSVAEFVKQYPNVGLMFCLGEALQGLDNQVNWCTQVLLPGVKDGMAQAHLTSEPPVIIRTHATDATVVIPAALKVYKNLYTEAKYNGESLTTWEPRGVRQQLHLAMSHLGSTHLINVHILANLEPFRYGDQQFIQKCVIAARDRLGARGVHLYPLSYWNWPDSPDKTDVPLKQWDRDWIWFEAWARYAWNPDIDPTTDHAYWIFRVGAMYGPAAAEDILAAYNDSGECAPRLLRRFGITEGNRQTLSLGMTLDQLVNPAKYGAFDELWESQSPPGERLDVYVQTEWEHQPHQGETPPQIIDEVLKFSSKAVAEIDAAAPVVTSNRAEYERLRNDIHCIAFMSQSYCDKANAAMLVLRYHHSHEPSDMEKALAYLAKSLDEYRSLARLGGAAYEFANGMQTGGRQIPAKGAVNGKAANYLWSQLVPLYQKELDDFGRTVERLKRGSPKQEDESAIQPLPAASFSLLSTDAQTYEIRAGAKIFTDENFTIRSLAPELRGLIGIRFSHAQAKAGKYHPIEFAAAQPVRVLIGYFKSSDKSWLQVPRLETDALAAERGDTDPLIQNAVAIDSLPAVDIYVQDYDAGRHELSVRGDGSFIVLGVITRSATVTPRDAHRAPTH